MNEFRHIKGDGVKANPRRRFHVPTLFLPRRRSMHVGIQLFGADGALKDERSFWNTVTQNGLNGIADQLLDSPSIAVPSHMAIGTGSPSATALGSELDRNALTSKTRSTDTITMVGDWVAGDGTGALTEAGVFNAAAAGTMYLSTSFSVVNKGAADGLTITWTLEVS